MKCIFIYNPNSGKGKILKKLDYIKQELEKKYDDVVVYSTKSQEDTVNIAKESCSKYDAIIFSGGDGTFNDIISGVSSQNIRPVLGYIPSGTVNDIARNLKIKKNIKKALKVILDGNYSGHDIGQINDKYFVYVAAIGTFSSVSYRTQQKYKKILGKLAYILDGAKDIINPSINTVKVTTDKGKVYEFETSLFLVLNSISVGGIPFNKHGHLNDGKFDIVFVKKIFRKGILSIANTMLLGIGNKKSTKYYEVIKCGNCKIEINNHVSWTIDGEKGIEGNVDIKNLHNHIQIFVPFKDNKPKSKHF